MRPHRDRKNIHDLALGRFNPHRSHQDHPGKDLRISRDHLGRNKSPGRISNHVNRIELQLAHHLRIKSRKIAKTPYPLELRSLSKTRLQRNKQLALMRNRLVPGHPPRIPKLIMKNEQRLPRPTPNHPQPSPRNAQSLLSRFDHNISPRLLTSLFPLPIRERIEGEGPSHSARSPRAFQDSALLTGYRSAYQLYKKTKRLRLWLGSCIVRAAPNTSPVTLRERRPAASRPVGEVPGAIEI